MPFIAALITGSCVAAALFAYPFRDMPSEHGKQLRDS
tara:strand:- start:209 stop:319 length:111 start_codon:yes stop_codon:yes gene_type:complete